MSHEIFKEGVEGTDLTVIEPENETSWNRAFRISMKIVIKMAL